MKKQLDTNSVNMIFNSLGLFVIGVGIICIVFFVSEALAQEVLFSPSSKFVSRLAKRQESVCSMKIDVDKLRKGLLERVGKTNIETDAYDNIKVTSRNDLKFVHDSSKLMFIQAPFTGVLGPKSAFGKKKQKNHKNNSKE